MFNIEHRLKELYRADSTDKHLVLDFYRPGDNVPFLHLLSENIESEALELSESLGSGENLDFGSCEASQMKITLIDVPDTVKNSQMIAYQVIEGIFPAEDLFPGDDVFPSGYVMPMGKYIVQSAEKQDNRCYLDVTALDFMSKFDVDVSAWYNALSFPISLRDFRASLCRHVGVTEDVPEYLPNDDILIDKTVDAGDLIGRQVLIACEQANGVFGHFDRNGVLQHVALQPNDCLVPAQELYPGDSLFPEFPGEMNGQVYDEQFDPYLLISCEFEEYTVKSIDRVQIRQEKGDIGALYGDGTNVYTVEGNFLLYGKTAAELEQIARGIYGMVSGRRYVPYESESKGLPYIEVGDALRFNFGQESIMSYVLKRTLKGIYALRDSYDAEGEEIRGVETDVNKEIIQLQGKAAYLVKNVDEVSAKVVDLAKNTEARFAVTAEAIESTVKRLGEAESSIKQTAEQIVLKVSKEDLVKDLNSELKITGNSIELTTGHFSVNASNLSIDSNGNLRCSNGEFSGKITAITGKIAGFSIEGNSLSATGDDTEIRFGNYQMDRNGATFKNVEIDERGVYIGSIGNRFSHMWESDTGDIYVNEVYIDDPWWKGWSVTQTVKELWNTVYGGSSGCSSDGGCGSDGGCNDDALIDDIGGCG